jgi:SAM-dependent methyltransferase
VAARRVVEENSGLPLPPAGLAARVGVPAETDPLQFYLDEGRRLRTVIEGLLPDDWRWADKQVLDFGCGAGRVLRQFAAEATQGELVGCDIDAPSIDWAVSHLSPPFRFFRNELTPPVALDAGSLDLIWAMSVFTHISDAWAEWLVELHRLLAPGGLLVASFLGEGIWEALIGSAYREEEVGMAVSRKWDGPAAWVFHSEWWLREHWGRGFEVTRVVRPPRSSDGQPEITHSYIALRKRDVELSADVLESIDPREHRELAGLQTSLRLAYLDVEYLSGRGAQLTPRGLCAAGLRSARQWLRTRMP